MIHKILYLPCFVYAISFSSIILLYQVGWSDMFPVLNGFLLYFLLATIGISIVLAFIQKKHLNIPINDVNLSPSFIKRAMYFIGIGYTLEFLYESSIPIIKTFFSPSYSYDDFNGIPTFHFVLGTFSIFFSILMFNYYLSNRSRKKMFQFIATLVPYILIMNRGAFMIVFSAMIFLFIMRMKAINLKTIIMPFVVLGIVLYFFGVVGNIRAEQTKEDKEYLLRVAGATDKFIKSGVPVEFYWSYIYIISPIGNLQNLMIQKKDVFEIDNVGVFTITQLFPDFISKRLSAFFLDEKNLENVDGSGYFVTPLLNAPTVYFGAYVLLGSVGLVVMFFVIMFSTIIYPYLIKKNSKYYSMSIASLNAIILLSIFNNMWFNVGTVLLWPIIFSAVERLKLK